jgi:hypothetical protein
MRYPAFIPVFPPSPSRLAAARASAAVVIGCLFFCLVCQASAQPPRLVFTKQVQKGGYMTYTVKKGDHLYAIIRDQGFLEQDIPEILKVIRTLNPNLDPSAPIHPGQSIRLPSGPKTLQREGFASDQRAQPAKPALTPSAPPHAPEAYTLKRGDTLLGIMRQKTRMDLQGIMGSYMRNFLALNPTITDINRVYPGQRVLLPRPSRTGKSFLHPPRVRDGRPAVRSSPELPGISPDRARTFVRECLEIMGFTVVRGDETFFPLPGKAWLRVDTTVNILVTTPWGGHLLLVPSGTGHAPGGDLAEAGISVCAIPVSWNPVQVMQALTRSFPDKMTLSPNTIFLEKTIGQVHASLSVGLCVHAGWSQPETTHCFHVLDQKQQPFPAVLTSLLLKGDIRLAQWQRDTTGRLARIDHPHIREKDIYVPTISPDKQDTLVTHRWGQTFDLAGLPPVPETRPRPMEITLDWTAGTARILLTARVLQLDNEETRVILLDPKMKDPYLVALLGLKGIAVHALESEQEPTD